MEVESINKLYLELSQFATAKTRKELELRQILQEFVEHYCLWNDETGEPKSNNEQSDWRICEAMRILST